MECILEAHPVPDITWYQGQKTIADSKRVKMSRKATGKDTYLLTLEISNPTKADGGNYRCNAFNNFGESNANISLNFQGKSPSKRTRGLFTGIPGYLSNTLRKFVKEYIISFLIAINYNLTSFKNIKAATPYFFLFHILLEINLKAANCSDNEIPLVDFVHDESTFPMFPSYVMHSMNAR